MDVIDVVNWIVAHKWWLFPLIPIGIAVFVVRSLNN